MDNGGDESICPECGLDVRKISEQPDGFARFICYRLNLDFDEWKRQGSDDPDGLVMYICHKFGLKFKKWEEKYIEGLKKVEIVDES